MAIGPGVYDDIATHARETTKAEAVVVIVLGGDRGSGFSVQAYRDISDVLPRLLRKLANEIEASTGTKQ